MERLTAHGVKSSIDRRYFVWQVARGAPALTHARRRHDWKVNSKGILRPICEDNLLLSVAFVLCPVVLDAHRCGESAARWTAKERVANTPFRETPNRYREPHEIASKLPM